MEMRMKEEELLEKRERDLRKKVFCTICFSQYGVHHPRPKNWRAGVMMRIKAAKLLKQTVCQHYLHHITCVQFID